MTAGSSESPSRPSLAKRASQRAYARIESAFSVHGWAFRSLSMSYAANVAGDTLIALALADSLFFSVPSVEARTNVIAYLLITVAPFALVAPLLGNLFLRHPGSYRAGLVGASLLRAVVAVALLWNTTNVTLFLLAFGLLALSRIYGISRSAILPVALPQPVALVSANARLARLGFVAGALVVPVGLLANVVLGVWATLVLGIAAFILSAATANTLRFDLPLGGAASTDVQDWAPHRTAAGPRAVRFARIATAVVRMLNGYLLLLLAFAFRESDATLVGFGAILGAAGLGFAVASTIAPFLERKLAEEPMVVAALAIEAAAAFIGAQLFGIPAAAVLAASAGLAWGTAKFGYDGLLQHSIPPDRRGAAFTRSETLFQLAWVFGAILPVLFSIPTNIGLLIAGCVALLAQVIIVSGLLVSIRDDR